MTDIAIHQTSYEDQITITVKCPDRKDIVIRIGPNFLKGPRYVVIEASTGRHDNTADEPEDCL